MKIISLAKLKETDYSCFCCLKLLMFQDVYLYILHCLFGQFFDHKKIISYYLDG